jgi:hypothetical protein
MCVIISNITFEEGGSFENSTISSSLRGQALYTSWLLHKFQAWKITLVTVIHCVREVAVCVYIPAVNRRLVM